MNRKERRAERSEGKRRVPFSGLAGRIFRSGERWKRTGDIDLPFDDTGFDLELSSVLEALAVKLGKDFPAYARDLFLEAGSVWHEVPGPDGPRESVVDIFFIPLSGVVEQIEEIASGNFFDQVAGALSTSGMERHCEILVLPHAFDVNDICDITPGRLRMACDLVSRVVRRGDDSLLSNVTREVTGLLNTGPDDGLRNDAGIEFGSRMLIGFRSILDEDIDTGPFDEAGSRRDYARWRAMVSHLVPERLMLGDVSELEDAKSTLAAIHVYGSLRLQALLHGETGSISVSLPRRIEGDFVHAVGIVGGREIGVASVPARLVGFDPPAFFDGLDRLFSGNEISGAVSLEDVETSTRSLH